MAEWSTGVVKANGLEIAYHRSGADGGKPALLMLHGYTDNGLCWLRMARDLEKEFDVIMTDARGHGRTRGKIVDLGIRRLAGDAAAVIRDLSLDRPIVFGHSMGAQTTLGVAAEYPDLLRAAVLEDPVFLPPMPDTITEEMEEQFRKNTQNMLEFHALPLEEKLARGRKDNPAWSEDEMWPWAESKSEYDVEIAGQHLPIGEYPWRDAVARVQCPTLVITAEKEKGAIVSPEIAAEAVKLNGRFEIAHISGAGHCIHRDRYAETLASALAFMRRFAH